jgi:hypothetical protein
VFLTSSQFAEKPAAFVLDQPEPLPFRTSFWILAEQ